MSFTTTYNAKCGCVFDIDIAHDWVGGSVEIDDVCIVVICDKHCPTKLAHDAEEVAALNSTINASAESTSKETA